MLVNVCVSVCVCVCVCARGLSDPLQGAELIEILTSGACNETTDITSLCATASHWVQRENARGLLQLLKPILAHYLNLFWDLYIALFADSLTKIGIHLHTQWVQCICDCLYMWRRGSDVRSGVSGQGARV